MFDIRRREEAEGERRIIGSGRRPDVETEEDGALGMEGLGWETRLEEGWEGFEEELGCFEAGLVEEEVG